VNWDILLLTNVIAMMDLLDLIVRLAMRGGAGYSFSSHVRCEGKELSARIGSAIQPYAILVSVHNLGAGLKRFLKAMDPYRKRLWIIDDASTDDTWKRLKRARVHCIRSKYNRHKPGAVKELLAALPADIVTVMVLDPDCRIRCVGVDPLLSLERILVDFQRSGMAAMCPQLTIREASWLARLQAFEYCLAFGIGRKSLRDHSITSGIAVYRREALARVLNHHSLSVYAEDLKNALILMQQDERIYYDERLVVETESKSNWPSWFSQRVGWSFGFIKVYAEHWRGMIEEGFRRPPFVFYQYVLYMGVFGLVLHPFRVLSLAVLTACAANGLINDLLGLGWVPDIRAVNPAYCLVAYLTYTAIALLAFCVSVESGDRCRLLPIVPLYFPYVLAHILPVTIGYLNWFSVKMWHRRLYRDHYQGEASLQEQPATASA
jgi:cellulose synthase/poly-beta-1,6-N-acetylglucosamine synthase-like glycosyltransferase